MPLGWNESRYYGEAVNLDESRHYGAVVNLDLRSFRKKKKNYRVPAHGGVYI